jgi:uncharacterized protein YfaS (alpha-2-macroglobulin family)
MPWWIWLIIAILGAALIILLALWRRSGIFGVVLSSVTGLPVQGSSVVLTDEAGNTLSEAVTKEDGKYAFRRIRRGTYIVTAAHQAYRTGDVGTVSVELRTFGRAVRDLRLEPPSSS